MLLNEKQTPIGLAVCDDTGARDCDCMRALKTEIDRCFGNYELKNGLKENRSTDIGSRSRRRNENKLISKEIILIYIKMGLAVGNERGRGG